MRLFLFHVDFWFQIASGFSFFFHVVLFHVDILSGFSLPMIWFRGGIVETDPRTIELLRTFQMKLKNYAYLIALVRRPLLQIESLASGFAGSTNHTVYTVIDISSP